IPKIARGRATGASSSTSPSAKLSPAAGVRSPEATRSRTVEPSAKATISSPRTSPASGAPPPGGRKVARRIAGAYASVPAVAALTTRERIALAVVVAFTTLAGIARYANAKPVLAFALATIALAGLAYVVSFATEQVGEQFGPAVTGLMQSTLGNLPELFVVIFALHAGQTVVAQTSIIGSIFANALLVLGLVIVVGATRAPDSCMRFGRKLANDTATLLLLCSFIIVLIALSLASSDPASHHVKGVSTIGAVCLLSVYVVWLIPYVRSEQPAMGEAGHAPRVP